MSKDQIHRITFLGSFPSVINCPEELLPEYAFIGRSNVGKSSLINMLCGRRKLARVSSDPGKTQLINLYDMEGEWRFADMPGYGYAKVSRTKRKEWKKMVETYLLHRPQLVCAFLLVDFRIPPQENDMEFARWMSETGIPFCILFTKTDKVKQKEKRAQYQRFEQRFLEVWTALPPIIHTSARTGAGRGPVLDYIRALNDGFRQQLEKQGPEIS